MQKLQKLAGSHGSQKQKSSNNFPATSWLQDKPGKKSAIRFRFRIERRSVFCQKLGRSFAIQWRQAVYSPPPPAATPACMYEVVSNSRIGSKVKGRWCPMAKDNQVRRKVPRKYLSSVVPLEAPMPLSERRHGAVELHPTPPHAGWRSSICSETPSRPFSWIFVWTTGFPFFVSCKFAHFLSHCQSIEDEMDNKKSDVYCCVWSSIEAMSGPPPLGLDCSGILFPLWGQTEFRMRGLE